MGCVQSKQLEMQPKELAWDASLKQNHIHHFSRSFPLSLRQSKPPEPRNCQLHVVALTSSTYGALKMEMKENTVASTPVYSRSKPRLPHEAINVPSAISSRKQQLTKSRIRSATEALEESQGPDVIDVWKLMEDLEEDSRYLKDGLTEKNTKAYGQSFCSLQANKTIRLDKKADQAVDPFRDKPPDKIYTVKAMSDTKDGLNITGVSASGFSHKRSIKGLLYGASLFSGNGLDSSEVIPEKKACEIAASRNKQPKTNSNGHSTPNYPGAVAKSQRFDAEVLDSVDRAVLSQLRDEDGVYERNGGESNLSCELHTPVMARCFFPELEDEHLSGTVARRNKIPIDFDVSSNALSNKKFSSSKVSDIATEEKKLTLNWLENFEMRCPPGGEDKVVLYFTSLRGIRKTYEDCNNLRMTLQGFNIRLDERDVSMHSGFRKELNELLEKPLPMPRLFIRGRYVGGIDEIAKLDEDGLLEKLLEGIPLETSWKTCEGCGGVRFIPCPNCSGSCKIISDMKEVLRCPECNENGLVRCPICC